jgi:hypothetical protein
MPTVLKIIVNDRDDSIRRGGCLTLASQFCKVISQEMDGSETKQRLLHFVHASDHPVETQGNQPSRKDLNPICEPHVRIFYSGGGPPTECGSELWIQEKVDHSYFTNLSSEQNRRWQELIRWVATRTATTKLPTLLDPAAKVDEGSRRDGHVLRAVVGWTLSDFDRVKRLDSQALDELKLQLAKVVSKTAPDTQLSALIAELTKVLGNPLDFASNGGEQDSTSELLKCAQALRDDARGQLKTLSSNGGASEVRTS